MGHGRRALYLLSTGFLALWMVAHAQAQVAQSLPPDVETSRHILVSRASAELSQPWLAPGEDLTLESLTRLMNVAHLDPALDAQLNGLMESLGLTTESLLPLLRVSDGTSLSEAAGSHTAAPMIRGHGMIDPSAAPGSAPVYAPAIETARQAPGAHVEETRYGSLGVISVSAGMGTICIERNTLSLGGDIMPTNLLDSFLYVMHELTHMTGHRHMVADELIAFDSLDAYIDATLMAPGGEWDAYVAQGTASARLMRQLPPGSMPRPALLRYFDGEGNLTDPAGLRNYILAPNGEDVPLVERGLNYRRKFLDDLTVLAAEAARLSAMDYTFVLNVQRVDQANIAELQRVESLYREFAQNVDRSYGPGTPSSREALERADSFGASRLAYENHLAAAAADARVMLRRRCALWQRYHDYIESRAQPWPDTTVAADCSTPQTTP